MSTGNPRSNDKVHGKRQRTASQDSNERKAVKKARSGTDPQSITFEVNLSITLSPQQSTTRHAARDVGHDTKQDWLDFQRAGEGHHKLTHSSLGSTGPPQRLPLTEESLSLLNSNKSPPKEVIDASHPTYLKELRYRQISFANESRHRHPSGLDKWLTTLRAPRASPEPDQTRVKSLLGATDRTLNKDEMLEHIVPDFVPIIDLNDSDRLFSVMKREWKSKLDTALKPGLTPPIPSLTIGWQTDLFDKFPKAMASLDASACPVPSAEDIA